MYYVCIIFLKKHMLCVIGRRNYVKAVHKNNAVVSLKKCTLFLFSLEKYKFYIRKWLNMGIVLINGDLWFSCVNSPESAVCHVTGIMIVGLRNPKSARISYYLYIIPVDVLNLAAVAFVSPLCCVVLGCSLVYLVVLIEWWPIARTFWCV